MSPNTSKYFLFKFFFNLEFFGPVIVLFWLSHGLDMTQVMLLQSIFAIGVIILELPTGALADYFGKRISLIFGSLLFSVGLILYGLSSHFWQFLIGELIVASSMAFISGADSALLHEMLRLEKKDQEFKKQEGRSRALSQFGRVLGNALGGFIAQFSLGLTLIATGIASIFSFLMALSFPQTQDKLARAENTNYLQVITESLKISVKNHQVLWLTLFYTFFNSVFFSIAFLSQPYIQAQGVPVKYFGLIFASFGLVNALGSALTNRFVFLTKNKSYSCLFFLALLTLLMIAIFPSKLIIIFWALNLTLLSMSKIIVAGNVLDLVPHSKAATVLSFQNLSRRLVYAIVGPIIGFVSDKFSMQVALLLAAALLLVSVGPVLVVKDKFFVKKI